MAHITFEELVDLADKYTNWKENGWSPPKDTLSIGFGSETNGSAEIFDKELARKSITYEAQNATIVMDFDDNGFLNEIEII